MPRPAKPRRPLQSWFRIDAYACDDLDRLDWYINLWTRRWLLMAESDPNEARVIEQSIDADPVLRRVTGVPDFLLLDIADIRLKSAIRGEPARRVWRASREEARRLADDACFDDLLAPFVRVDLAESDAKLAEAFAAWVSTERRRLLGTAPASPGLRAGAKKLHAADVASWARLRVLAIADLLRRVPDSTDAELADAAVLSEDEVRSVRRLLGELFADGFSLERRLI